LVPASINADPINPVVSQEADDENQQVSNNSTTLETCECYECGKEIREKEGYLADGRRICDRCEYEWRVMEKPSAYYFDEKNETFDKMARENIKEDEEDVWEELASIIFPESVSDYIQKYRRHGSIMPNDALMIDDSFINGDTYEIAKEVFGRVLCEKENKSEEMSNAYIVSQQDGRFWIVLSKVVNDPTTFKVSLFARTDEVAKKYLRRLFDDDIYSMDYLLHPEDYPHDDYAEEDCASEEDMIKFYEEQEYETNYTNKALCVACGEVNYAEPVCEVEGHSRMVCCDCIEIVNCCKECNHLSLEYVYDSPNYDGVRVANGDLCFDCKFKKPLREQMPLEVHLSIRSDIQVLTRQQFDILADYAELCEFTIFDAYRYKSRCHYYDCDRMVPPSEWDAEEAVQFCCHRHEDIADHIGCHFQNVYDGSDYDEDWEQATCKVCNNCNHDTNMIPRIALRESDQGVKPIDSAICMFEELGLNNLLFENLVDLCEYF